MVEGRQLNYAVLFGNKSLAEKYFLYGLPLYIIVDQEGIVRHTTTGFSPEIEQVIDQILQ